MSEPTQKTTLLDACVAKTQSLVGLAEYAADSIVSKTILEQARGSITLFAFDQDQKLSQHTSPYDAVVQVIDGRAHLVIGGEGVDVAAGELIIMPANVPHAVVAFERFKMLLTMIGG
jgi:quercetin dioxygenase-like cupin family protein